MKISPIWTKQHKKILRFFWFSDPQIDSSLWIDSFLWTTMKERVRKSLNSQFFVDFLSFIERQEESPSKRYLIWRLSVSVKLKSVQWTFKDFKKVLKLNKIHWKKRPKVKNLCQKEERIFNLVLNSNKFVIYFLIDFCRLQSWKAWKNQNDIWPRTTQKLWKKKIF